jgi:uncharacterized protein (DUF1800 family)
MRQSQRRRFIQVAAVAAASTIYTACVAKTPVPQPVKETPTLPSLTNTPGTPAQQPTATLPAPQPTMTAPSTNLPDLGRILYHRLAFGPRPTDLEEFLALGSSDAERLGAFLDSQLNPGTIADDDFERRYQAAAFETLHLSLTELADKHIVNNPYPDNDDRHWQWYIQPVEELVEATFLRSVFSRRQLQELLVDFWHNHFNVYGWQDDVTPLFVSFDRDVIRKYVFGSFRQFLEAVASHPSMLFYLNNRTNSDAGPNENFARELFELYTLGAENYLGVRDPKTVPLGDNGLAVGYVDNDIYEAARCFTGWRVEDDRWEGEEDVNMSYQFLYYRPWHDRFNKIILGQYLPADQPDLQDGRTVLDLLCDHPGTAMFIARKLCRRFVADNPPDALVSAVAQVFYEQRNAPDQLRQVYRAIFLSAEFRSTWQAKIKRPFELASAALRALDADFTRLSGDARWTFEMMGQQLFGHHPPDGYADIASAWANTMSTLYSWNFITAAAQNWWNQDKEGKNLQVDLETLFPPDRSNAEAIIDTWLERLFLQPFPDESRQALVDFLSANPAARLGQTLELILMSPEFHFR